MEEKEERIKLLVSKYNINLGKLEKEQEKLAKRLEIKDAVDFSKISKIGGFANVFFQNKIISAAVVVDSEMNVIEQKYFSDRIKFPYIPGFRAYREMPAMVSCFSELDEKPELIFINGHGISHPRLGIASHFSLAIGTPTIGVAESLISGEAVNDSININGKIVGRVLQEKLGSKPIYVSPGNMISVKTASEMAKNMIKLPHKLPEPLHLARRYARELIRELF